MQISFHTFRHWKATTLYYQTKDILYVMKFLGHRNIKNTLVYTQLAKFSEKNELVCKVAINAKEAKNRLSLDFNMSVKLLKV
ncbi:MAG: tyrosine-type recombinase/integrase [Candidatus Freyarchaeota archaeon]